MNNRIKKVGLIVVFFISCLVIAFFAITLVGSVLELLSCYKSSFSASSGCPLFIPLIVLIILVSIAIVVVFTTTNYVIARKLEMHKVIQNYASRIYKENRAQKISAFMIVSFFFLIIYLEKKDISIGVFIIYYVIILYLIKIVNFTIKKVKDIHNILKIKV